MSKKAERTVLFLCTGNYYRSRYAEILFNSVVAKMGLPWRATSRALALETGGGNVGPISRATLKALEKDKLHTHPDCGRMPIQATEEDFANAHRIVAVKKDEHLPMLAERFPAWAEKVEFWHVDDAPGTLEIIEREVMALAARLITGAPRPNVIQLEVPAEPPPPPTKPKPGPVVKVGRETKGRGGKGVTIVSEIPLNEAGLKDLAAKLKQRCGTGGTVKDGHIEIQGDQRDRVTAELERLGFRVKRAGG